MDRIVFFALCFLVPLMSLVDGARNPLLMIGFALVFNFLLLIWMSFAEKKSSHGKKVLRKYKLFWWFQLLWVLYGVVHLLPVGGAMAPDVRAVIRELIWYSGLFSLTLLFALTTRSPGRAKAFFSAIVVMAVLQTMFGMYNYYSDEFTLAGVPDNLSDYRVSGTFINRNFYANYVVMATGPLLIYLILSARKIQTREQTIDRLVKSVALLMIALYLLIGVVLSQSRAGVVGFGAALLVVLLLSQFNNRSKISPLVYVGSVVGGFIVALTSDVALRFQGLAIGFDGRIEQWLPTYNKFQESWLLGFGGGNYEQVFKLRNFGELGPLIYDHAHNDYLEVLLEQGLVGAVILCVLSFYLIFRMIKRYRKSQSLIRQKILLSCSFALVATMVHSFVDFPLQIPANAALFACFVGILIAGMAMDMTHQKPKAS